MRYACSLRSADISLDPRVPCAQTIHVAIGHTERGGDENRIVNLQVCGSVGTGNGDILLGDVLSSGLDFPSNIQ